MGVQGQLGGYESLQQGTQTRPYSCCQLMKGLAGRWGRTLWTKGAVSGAHSLEEGRDLAMKILLMSRQ